MDKIKIIDMCVDDFGQFGVHAISVVEKPAIQVDFVALNEDKPRFIKLEADEKRMLYGAILIPDQLIYRVDEETKEEYYIRYSKEVIEKTAYNYLKNKNQGNATLEHAVPIEGLTLVESWLTDGTNDKSKTLGFDLPNGTWFGGIKVDNADVWEAVKDGKVKGFSIEGYFIPAKEQLLSDHAKLLQELEEILKGN